MASNIDDNDKKLVEIKKNIDTAYAASLDNIKRYHEFRNFVFRTSISDAQRSILNDLQRPCTEFNILEAYLNRLVGEFALHEPSVNMMPSEGKPIDKPVLDITRGYTKYVLQEADKNSFGNDTYRDSLSGGFSVAKVRPDYIDEMSFQYCIVVERTFDPTLCGFDPMARNKTKSDGNFCFEFFPMLESEFKESYPDFSENKVDYLSDTSGFSWNYVNAGQQKIVMVCDYYAKKKKRVKIYQLSNGNTITKSKYKALQKVWEERQILEQIPQIVGNGRWTEIETICRYVINGQNVLKYEETDFKYLPLVFMDGNSIDLTQTNTNTSFFMTRPYIYHAKGIQDLKNFSGQTLCNFLENITPSKFIVKKEALPQEQDYMNSLNDPQRGSLFVVNAFYENQPGNPIPEPIREVTNVPAPPEVMASFQVTDPTTQMILGSFASNLGQNDRDLSGKAVIETASIGNATAMPYVMGYLAGLTQIATIIVDLIPKYITGKRHLPIIDDKGKKQYARINEKGSPYLDYDEKSIHVNVEAGVNFQVQKNQAVQQIISLTQSNQTLNEFFNSEDGLPILAKNLTIYGADQLEDSIKVFFDKKKQQQQQAMQMQQQAMQQNPQMLRAQAELQKVQMSGQQNQIDNQISIAKLAIEKELADAKLLESESKITQEKINSAVRLEEAQTSIETHALDSAAKMAEIQSRVHNDRLSTIELHHKIKGENHGNEIQTDNQ